VVTGIALWKKYIEFETDEYEEYLEVHDKELHNETEEDKEIKKSLLKRFISLFHRQFSLPLVGNEQSVKEFEKVVETYCFDKEDEDEDEESDSDNDDGTRKNVDERKKKGKSLSSSSSSLTSNNKLEELIQQDKIEKSLSTSLSFRDERLSFEMIFLSEKYSHKTINEKMKNWKDYISYELSQKQYQRAKRLYERCFIDVSSEDGIVNNSNVSSSDQQQSNNNQDLFLTIWLEYLHLSFNLLKDRILTRSVCQRALKHYSTCYSLRKLSLLCYQYSCSSSSSVSITLQLAAIKEEFQFALTTGFTDATDYFSYYFTYLNGIRRSIDSLLESFASSFSSSDVASLSSSSFETLKEDLRLLVTEMKETVETTQQFLSSYYPTWCEGWEKLAFYSQEMMISRILPIESWLKALSPSSARQREKEEEEEEEEEMEVENLETNEESSPSLLFHHFFPAFSSTSSVSSSSDKQASLEEKKHQKILFHQKYAIWETLLSQQFPTSYYCYCQYIRCLILHREYDQCRLVYKKLLHLSLDIDKAIVLNDWLSFEENYCSFDSFQSAFTYCFPLLIPSLSSSSSQLTATDPMEPSSINSYSSSSANYDQQQQGGRQQNKGITVSYNDKKKGNKRSHQESEEETTGDDKKKKRKVQFDDSKILTLEIDNQLPPSEISSSLSSSSIPPSSSHAAPVKISQPVLKPKEASSSLSHPVKPDSGMNISSSSSSSSTSDISNDSSEIKTNILQFRNLPFAASLIEISTFFQHFQSFSKIEMVYTKAGNFRGMVNIEYSSKEDVEKMLELIKSKEEGGMIVFQGRNLEMEKNISSLENINPLIFRTVFINHLPSSATEIELEELFSTSGKVEAVHIAKDKRTQQLKVSYYCCCYCCCYFLSYDDVLSFLLFFSIREMLLFSLILLKVVIML
jgi:RNA recognition motif-containing protein